MTIEEVLKFFKDFIETLKLNGEDKVLNNDYCKASTKAIEALEKQIVKKPVKKLGDWIDAPRCSKCERLIKGGYLHAYCPICGQKYREVEE